MDLKSGYPFWAIKNGLMCAFPQLEADISPDVVVVGYASQKWLKQSVAKNRSSYASGFYLGRYLC